MSVENLYLLSYIEAESYVLFLINLEIMINHCNLKIFLEELFL